MFDYLAFIYAGLSEASGDALKDGEYLGKQCRQELDAIENSDRLPPKLLILLASPAYGFKQDAKQLLKGVNSSFGRSYREVDLVGSSVGGVFFDRRIHPHGALLICLASKLIEAQVGYGINARQHPERAITELLKNIELDPSRKIDPNPLANRLILTFMPGCNRNTANGDLFPAPHLHRLLYEGVQARISLIGGVSSANDWSLKKDGFQFVKGQVLRDSIVAASIVTGVPIGVSLNDGLITTGDILRVTKLGSDKRTILAFNDRNPSEELDRASAALQLAKASAGDGQTIDSPSLDEIDKPVQTNRAERALMLAKLSAGDERTVDVPLPSSDGSVQLLRPVEPKDHFQVFYPGSDIVDTALDGISQAKRRVYVEKPIASFVLPCNAYNPRRERGIEKAEEALARIEKEQGAPCVGGFFDGELGIDETGRSRLTNGGVSYVIFGDEMRERTPLHRGVSALANYEPQLLGSKPETTSIYDAIDIALKIIDETGFPGAMISLVLPNLNRISQKEEEFIIAIKAYGSRFKKIVDLTKRARTGDDILAIVSREPAARGGRFIRESSKNPYCDQVAVTRSGIVSQYVLPLKRLDNSVFGLLQVDLGDLQHLSEADFRRTEIARTLDCFADVIGASINRMASTLENKIMLSLDRALKNSLSAATVREGLTTFFGQVKGAFGVENGFLRLLTNHDNPKRNTLVLETGFGPLYEAEVNNRREISVEDHTPISFAIQTPGPEIVNDVREDQAWREMLEGIRDPELSESLSLTKSYATVPFLSGDNEVLGAISVGSTKQWYFLKPHQNALSILAERLTFLIQHLRAKIERNFLIDVSPKLGEQNLSDTVEILENLTADFREALNADVASLYLWDHDRKTYVLRAASGWHDSRWVHAASYSPSTDAGWIGIKAINLEPLYVSDLQSYYLEVGHPFPTGRYAEQMFGQQLSDTFVVEAVGLPLRIGQEKTDKFGVLTLYRRKAEGQPTGFATVNMQLLLEAAYKISGLVSAALNHRDEMWEKEEGGRRQEVYQGVNSTGKGPPFERRACWHVLKAFRAANVDFYSVDKDLNSRPIWLAGARRTKDRVIVTSKRVQPDRLVQKALRTRQLEIERKQPPPELTKDPLSLKTKGLVTRVCIPLMAAKVLRGILDVRWQIGPHQAYARQIQHSDEQLTILGQVVGSAYLRYQMLHERKQSTLALEAMTAYSAQRGHLMRNTVTKIYDQLNSVKLGRADLSALDGLIKVAREIARETVSLGKRVVQPSIRQCRLLSLIKETLADKDRFLEKRILELKIRFTNEVPETCMVRVDPNHTGQALFNLLNNAIDAIEKNKKLGQKLFAECEIDYKAFVPDDHMVRVDPSRRLFEDITNMSRDLEIEKEIESMLTIPAINVRVTTHHRRTRLFISDNGVGMLPSEITDALSGFVEASDQSGVGVLISRLLLAAQGGKLRFRSKKYVSTDAILTLPSGQMENIYETGTVDGSFNSDNRE